MFQWPWGSLNSCLLWYYSSDLFSACRHQSGLVTISPTPATCAQALLYLCCDNHKEGSRQDCASYLQRALSPVRNQKVTRGLKQIKKHGMLVQDFISSCQTESKRKPETLKKEYRFLWQQNKKTKKRHLIVSYFLDNVLLGCSGLDWVMFNLFQQHASLSQREHDITPLSSTWYTRSSQFSRFKCSMQLGANVNPQLEILASGVPWLRR